MEQKQETSSKTVHIPVLLHDVITVLALEKGDRVVDGTLGGGGYTEEILQHLGKNGKVLGIDADRSALRRVEERLKGEHRVVYREGNFRTIDTLVEDAQFGKVTKIVLDLGLSSDQLEAHSERGFSFMRDEPLVMTFTYLPSKDTLTAWHVVNEWGEDTLADIIYGFGGEKRARKIAHAIVEARSEKPIETSGVLAEVISNAVTSYKGIHPATKTFQAIRMAVNDELGALEDVLKKSLTLLEEGGRIAIVTFHSLEDRLVKQTFRDWESEGRGKRITKKPIVPTRSEVLMNRRARSAKVRCFEKRGR